MGSQLSHQFGLKCPDGCSQYCQTTFNPIMIQSTLNSYTSDSGIKYSQVGNRVVVSADGSSGCLGDFNCKAGQCKSLKYENGCLMLARRVDVLMFVFLAMFHL